MRTLDEVIDYCEGKQTCGEWVGIADVLHYLKEYQRYQNTPSRNGHMALVDYFEESQKNEPLTWEELRTMKGKPVWIETDDNEKFWTLVDNFRIICNQECLCCSKGYMCQSTHARGDWQAYRKERSH